MVAGRASKRRKMNEEDSTILAPEQAQTHEAEESLGFHTETSFTLLTRLAVAQASLATDRSRWLKVAPGVTSGHPDG